MKKPDIQEPHSLHIVLPQTLFDALRERAALECESMRRITIEALKRHLAQPRREARP